MAFDHFDGLKKDKSNDSKFGISHSSIHDEKHKNDFHSSIHDHKKIHESMHFGKDKIISPFNHNPK